MNKTETDEGCTNLRVNCHMAFPGYVLDRRWSNAITNNGAELLIRIVGEN